MFPSCRLEPSQDDIRVPNSNVSSSFRNHCNSTRDRGTFVLFQIDFSYLLYFQMFLLSWMRLRPAYLVEFGFLSLIWITYSAVWIMSLSYKRFMVKFLFA